MPFRECHFFSPSKSSQDSELLDFDNFAYFFLALPVFIGARERKSGKKSEKSGIFLIFPIYALVPPWVIGCKSRIYLLWFFKLFSWSYRFSMVPELIIERKKIKSQFCPKKVVQKLKNGHFFFLSNLLEKNQNGMT